MTHKVTEAIETSYGQRYTLCAYLDGASHQLYHPSTDASPLPLPLVLTPFLKHFSPLCREEAVRSCTCRRGHQTGAATRGGV